MHLLDGDDMKLKSESLLIAVLGMPCLALASATPPPPPPPSPKASIGYAVILNDLQGTWSQCDDTGYGLCDTEKARFGSNKKGASVFYQENVARAIAKINGYVSNPIGGVGKGSILGVVANGDITAFGDQAPYSDINDLYNFEKNLGGIPFLPGLGNHDIENNVDDCWRNYCANGILGYFAIKIKDRPPFQLERHDVWAYWDLVSGWKEGSYQGSMAYSWVWNVGERNYRFVQLNNAPNYTRQWANGTTALDRKTDIRSGIPFLRQELAAAAQKGDVVILNYHKPEGVNDISDMLLNNYNVKAIFNGHWHTRPQKAFTTYGVPSYVSGNPRGGDFLLARLGQNMMMLFNVRVNHFDSKQTVNLITKNGRAIEINKDNANKLLCLTNTPDPICYDETYWDVIELNKNAGNPRSPFTIKNSLYNGCLDFRGGASDNKPLSLNPNCHMTGSQVITYNPSLKQLKVKGTNYCLDVQSGQNNHRQPVIAYTCHGQRNQQWLLNPDSTISSMMDGVRRCLDVDQHQLDSKGNPTVSMWECTPGSGDQQFSVAYTR